MTKPERWERLNDAFQGRLIRPDDADYDDARRIWNGMIDTRPAVIARCASTDDVVSAVTFARDNDLVLAVRCGGHNVSGNATCDDGVVIDLRSMNRVTVDGDRRTALAEGGTIWGEYDAATQRHGLASPGGAISTTGIAGLTLGGGVGWLSRSYGLACDNLIGAEVVTADGRIVNAGADENAELFWGLRGGGGNFGVVTRFHYRLHPLTEVYAGLILYPRASAPDLMRAWRDLTASAPEPLSSMAAFLSNPDGEPVVGVYAVYNGPARDAERAIAPLRSLGTPLLDDIGPKPYTVTQKGLDDGFPAGNRNYWKSNYLAALGDDAIDTLVDYANRAPTPLSVIGIEQMFGGAVARVGIDETAYTARDAEYNLLILGCGVDPSTDDAVKSWTRSTWKAVQPFSTGAVYVNYMDRDETDRIHAAYGTNFARLQQLKRQFDPENRFRRNQNVPPAT